MRTSYNLKLLLVFSTALSLAAIGGPMFGPLHLSGIQTVHAIPQPCETHGSGGVCSEYWYPGGPEMDTQLNTIADVTSQYTCITSQGCLDFPDRPVPPAFQSQCIASSGLYFTAPINGASWCYPSNWQRIINGASDGLPNYFTWLNAWSPTPVVAGTFRQGFSQTTRSINPYIASTTWDTWVVGNVYDSLFSSNTLDPTTDVYWMVVSEVQLSNSSLTYQAPPSTLTTYRFTLRNDLSFQDGRPVTAYDVAFSYLSMLSSGASLGRVASAMTGITILSPRTFDIGVNSLGFTVLPNLTSIPIVPGRYWSNGGTSAWDSAVGACTGSPGCSPTQYLLSGTVVLCGATFSCIAFLPSLMLADPNKTIASYDPLANGILIGSGPWECKSSSGVLGTGCSSSGAQNPPYGGSYFLTRFGAGFAPAASVTGAFFRSAGNLALWFWASNGDPLGPNIITLSQALLCYGRPVNFGQCSHWQKGLGASATGVVNIAQISIIMRFFNVNWIAPFNWQTSPPTGIHPFTPAPVLYEATTTLNPCSVDPNNGYDC